MDEYAKMKLNVMIPYRKDTRLNNYNLQKKNIESIELDNIEFFFQDCEGEWNTAKAQNLFFENHPNCWVLKNDLDCLGNQNIYSYIIDWIQDRSINDFMILGAKYFDITGKQYGKICGNEYVVHYDLWNNVQRCPVFKGYGYEDYAFEYKLFRYSRPHYFLSNPTRENIVDIIREELIIPENMAHDYLFEHQWHDRDYDQNEIKENKKRLWEVVKEYENRYNNCD